jgi:serine/threonine protein kinase
MQGQATLPVGTVIQRQYLVEGLLGRSHAGATYLVREKPARDVPGHLFVLKEVVEASKPARRRLVSAGKLLRRLHHPGLPRLRQVFNDDKHHRVYWLVDYIAGQDLETLRQQQPQHFFTWTQVMGIMAPIMAAVTYLHCQRPPILHGDIKPANILIPGGDSGVVLVDCGMIKADTPGSTTAADRSRYRAPELYHGSIDVHTDIYALGATCYTLVTGKLPPDAHARLAQVGNEAVDPLEPVSSVVPALPTHVGKAIERAMALDAQHRFSSAEEFWEALWLALADHRAPALGQPPVPQGPPTVPATGLGQTAGQTIEKPAPEPLRAESVLEGIDEREDLDATVRLPRLPPVVPVPKSIEEQLDLDAEKPPPVVPEAHSDEERKDLDAEKPLPELPPVVPVAHSVEEQEAKTIRLASLPPIYLRRWLLYQSPKNKNHSGRSQGSNSSLQDVEEVSAQPVSSSREMASAEATVQLATPIQIERTQVSTTMPAPSMPKTSELTPIRFNLLWPILLILLVGIIVGMSLWSYEMYHGSRSATSTSALLHNATSQSSPRSTGVSTPSLTSSVNLVKLYYGTIYDIATNITTKMSLTGIQQTQPYFSGTFAGLYSTGTFTGIVDPSRYIQFTVKDSTGHLNLSFDGTMQSDGDLSGSYCSVDQHAQCTSDQGVWSVAPAS